jgi:hypothetical protein
LLSNRLLRFVATDRTNSNRKSELFEVVIDIRDDWRLIRSRRSQSREIRHTDVVQGVQCLNNDSSFVIRHSGREDARGPVRNGAT